MTPEPNHPAMNQRIFKMGLPMETVSIYLLCCSLADSDQAITTRSLMDVWNGPPLALAQGLEKLQEKNIIILVLKDSDGTGVYQLAHERSWEKA